MIVDTLRQAFHLAAPMTRDFAAVMRASFAYYMELQASFRDRLPDHLHQPDLNNLLVGELRPKLFNHTFCDRIPDTLRSLRRVIIRLEDLRQSHQDFPQVVNDLETLGRIADSVESLYQCHWEHYRYQEEFTERDLAAFLGEVDRVGHEWELYQASCAATHGLVQTLEGNPLPEHSQALCIAYQLQGQAHLAVESLNALTDFLRTCYTFACSIHDVDTAESPLTLLQVEVGEPVEIRMALPDQVSETYRRFLQYLFLKDILQREALLKFVMKAVLKQYRTGNPLPPAEVTAQQKAINARLKALPESGRFHIADRSYPEDGVAIMHEFLVSLESHQIPHKSLLRGKEKSRRPARVRKPVAELAANQLENTTTGSQPSAPMTPQGGTGEATPRHGGLERLTAARKPEHSSDSDSVQRSSKSHIRILTDSELEIPRPSKI